MKVIIIEDSKQIREKLSWMLNGINDIQVIGGASTAMDGLNLVRKNNPDFIIMKIELPDFFGIDLIKYIKKHYPLTVIAMITDHSYSYYRERCKELGADHFLDTTQELYKLKDILTKHVKQFDKDAFVYSPRNGKKINYNQVV